ncbi:MAG: peptide-methionine (S)-S-oxide reductase MsrA [Tissierellia bacterium]|nr:peptide-methionine (S)-S-oxide reductase MsrA [Tissierellia bacterium]
MKKIYLYIITLFSIATIIILPACSKTSNLINSDSVIQPPVITEDTATIYLAGGCFWGVEGFFQQIPGVLSVESGYANGIGENPSYYDVLGGDREFAETVKITYLPYTVHLEELLLRYFQIIDPLSVNQQGNDIGIQYRTGIYYESEEDLQIIKKIYDYESKRLSSLLAVELEPLKNFYKAEEYHQDYLEKNPKGYCHINLSDAFLPLFPGPDYVKEDSQTLKDRLGKDAYEVVMEGATEPMFSHEYSKEMRRGIYVSAVTGIPLFSSSDKFESGCGWPSFTTPITTDILSYLPDSSLGMTRIEVKDDVYHLGHVFEDGPVERGALRYCINGLSLKFIPEEDLDSWGLSDYKLFIR